MGLFQDYVMRPISAIANTKVGRWLWFIHHEATADPVPPGVEKTIRVDESGPSIIYTGTPVPTISGVGEGTTAKVNLTLSQPAAQNMVVEKGTQFQPDDADHQTMVARNDTVIPQGATSIQIATVCGSPFGVQPPPVQEAGSREPLITYRVLQEKSPLVTVFDAADGLGQEYTTLATGIGMPSEQFAQTVTQYAIWAGFAMAASGDDKEKKPFDQTTVTGILRDQVGDKATDEQIEKGAFALWQGTDLTIKKLGDMVGGTTTTEDGAIRMIFSTPVTPITEG